LARTDLGDKQVCPNCGAKFYDLRKRPATCPKCATAFDPADDSVRSRRSRSRVSANDALYKDEDEENEAGKKVEAAEDEDGEEETVEGAAEVDAEAGAETLLADDEDEDDSKKSGDELPEGFSEDEADLGDEAGDDDGVPMLEDEEEFSEDEIGELPGDGDDDGER
jgi:uncharacterized protein (TIGR02300 family)